MAERRAGIGGIGNAIGAAVLVPEIAPSIWFDAGFYAAAYTYDGSAIIAYRGTGNASDPGVTNIRNGASPHWRRWLEPANRCVVPATSFCEPSTLPDPATGHKVWTLFALNERRPLFFFAGIWCDWRGVRGTKKAPEEGDHALYGFLTTAPNATVKPVHERAMPVILRTREEVDVWMSAPRQVALELQRPLPDEAVKIVRRDAKEDSAQSA